MSDLYYKATRPDGTDFYSGTVDYAAALTSGELVVHPRTASDGGMVPGHADTYLSVSTVPAETLIGGSWPCRLFRVESVGRVVEGGNRHRYKRGVRALRVVEELPAWRALGPNGRRVAGIIERAGRLTRDEITKLAARKADRAAWAAARPAAIAAAWAAARDAAGAAARDAAGAEVVADLITDDQYQLLARPWLTAIGAPTEDGDTR